MKAPAIIASLTIACSLGFAAGQGRVPVPPQSPDQPSLPPASGDKRSGSYEGGVAMQVGGEGQCVIGEPLDWFTEAHPLPSCMIGSVIELPDRMASADIDGDGTTDYLNPVARFPNDQSCYGCLHLGGNSYTVANAYWQFQGGQVIDGDGVFRYSLSVNGDSVIATYQRVLSSAVLQAAVCTIAPCGSSQLGGVSVKLERLQDVDEDGDLDLIAQVSWGSSDNTYGSQGAVWLENTTVTNPPLAADINEDGVVDGKDLASVLAAWTP